MQPGVSGRSEIRCFTILYLCQKSRMKPFAFSLLCLLLIGSTPTALRAQHDQQYFPPEDSLVQQNLAKWSNARFGLLMHWGTYSQWGIVESWSLCPEDEDWCRRSGPWSGDYFRYREAYQKLQTTFNPQKFEATRWAKAAKEAGMRYVVFTTKHHDGFCMFNTAQTDYRVTSPDCPFSTDPRADITKEIFSAFRNEGFMIGAYFSKPDWHHPDYWDPYFPPYDRNPNYDLKKHPEKWARFKSFTFEQIHELMTAYGKIDILWLDGGWVQPMTATSPRWGKAPVHQDLDMPELAKMARSCQPGLIVVDRAVEGPQQNYLTPEQSLPDALLPYPWETCMTMATSWSYVENDRYKSTREILHVLCKIISRGGNFLLNIAPSPDGEWAPEAYDRLREIGAWMNVNGEAVHGSSPLFNSSNPDLAYVRGKNGSRYVFILEKENAPGLPAHVFCEGGPLEPSSQLCLLGCNQRLRWENHEQGFRVFFPPRLRSRAPGKYVFVIRIATE